MINRITVICMLLAVWVSMPTGAATAADQEALIRLHEEVMEAHRTGKADLLLLNESNDYIVAGRGEVTRPSLQDRRSRLTKYLGSTRFTEFVDMVPPEVTISADGSLGWVVVQVRAKGEQMDEIGKSSPVEFQSAWIELYARGAKGWQRVGNVSNFKP